MSLRCRYFVSALIRPHGIVALFSFFSKWPQTFGIVFDFRIGVIAPGTALKANRDETSYALCASLSFLPDCSWATTDERIQRPVGGKIKHSCD